MKEVFPPRMGRAERRRFKALTETVDRITKADRAFFERFPHRAHRLRLMSAAEREQLSMINGNSGWSPSGQVWAVAVKRVPGGRVRAYLTVPAGADLDVNEDFCRAAFDASAGGSAQGQAIENAMRQAFGRESLH